MGNRTRTTEMKKKNMEKDTNSFPHLPLSDSISHTNPKPTLTSEEQRQLNNKLLISVKANNITKVVLETYLEQGADINFLDYSSGFTPLMYAAWFGYTHICKLLIEHGADVNIQVRNDGSTALLYASYKGRLETVNYLLSIGANPLLKEKRGKTAHDWGENRETQQILKKYMGLWRRAGKKNTQEIFRAIKECNPDGVYRIFVNL